MKDHFIPGGQTLVCTWPYPNDAHRVCGAEATVRVQFRNGRVGDYCPHHARIEVEGGARYLRGVA